MQVVEQAVDVLELRQVARACLLHRCDCLVVGDEGRERQRLLAGNAREEQAHCVGNRESHRGKNHCGFFLDFPVNAGLDKLVRHAVD